ncbi:MAG: YitT family protein [Mycoplasmatales bacterium]
MKSLNYKKFLKEYAFLACAALGFTLASNLFLQPNQIVAGGFTGLGIVINYVFGWETATFYFYSNVILVTIAFFVLGKNYAFKTIIGSIVFFPFFLKVIPVIQLSDEVLINIVMSSILVGVAITCLFYSGGSSGGTAILGSIVHKYFKISFATAIAIFDVLIMMLGFIVFGFENGMYGIIIIVLCTLVSNYLTVGIKKSQLVYIISDNYEEISKAIINDLVRGITILDGTGGYEKKDKKVLMCVVNMGELKKVKEIIHIHDKNAFIIINSVSSTYGDGFELLIP